MGYYDPYITDDEWSNASIEELKAQIEIEKARLQRRKLLSELASVRAEIACISSGGSARRQKFMEPEDCDPIHDVDTAPHASVTENGHQSSSDEYTVVKNRRCKARKRGKRRTSPKSGAEAKCSEYRQSSSDMHEAKNILVEQLSKACQQLSAASVTNSEQISGIHDSVANRHVVSKQTFPHSQLQQEHLLGFSGENIEYNELSFVLFVAGEMEIISNPSTDPREAVRRKELLKVTAYRSQYMSWPKLFHLHAAILQKIESGRATWESDFDSVEKMVLENPGNTMNLGGSLGLDNADIKPCTQQRVLWCWNFNRSSCDGPHQHPDVVNGRHTLVKHICATCYQYERVERPHSESSSDCPWFVPS